MGVSYVSSLTLLWQGGVVVSMLHYTKTNETKQTTKPDLIQALYVSLDAFFTAALAGLVWSS